MSTTCAALDEQWQVIDRNGGSRHPSIVTVTGKPVASLGNTSRYKGSAYANELARNIVAMHNASVAARPDAGEGE